MSLVDERISTLVSPLLNFLSATLARFCPNRSQILSTSSGCEDPEKMHVWRMLRCCVQSDYLERKLVCLDDLEGGIFGRDVSLRELVKCYMARVSVTAKLMLVPKN